MTWIQDLFSPESRNWEEFYRNRWAHDKVVRSTHGVNCTGGCSWNVYVKQGLIAWEYQALDYPQFDLKIPSYEPRGCQRGISNSWYIYSALRVKYPYVRGALLDLWRAALAEKKDPIEAWASMVNDPVKRESWQKARGMGGFRRVDWNEVLTMVAAATLHTVKRHGADRVVGFSPIPAMSMISYAAGARYLQLLGGVNLSFYDWYCDLPPASPEVWGEQTDVGESADWFKSLFIAVVGSNVLMTRTPDAHFLVEARHKGAKVVVFSPDFSQTSKVADEWIPLHQGQDGAFWMAVGHVLLREFHVERKVAYFDEYLRQFSDGPFLVELEPDGAGGFRAGSMLRSSALPENKDEELGEWKMLVFDEGLELRMPQGTVGHRWQKKKGQWNLENRDSRTGDEYTPLLTLAGHSDEIVNVAIDDFSEPGPARQWMRSVPARRIATVDGDRLVTTAFDLLLAQYGVSRDLGGDARDAQWPSGYDDPTQPFTPAWQEQFTGVSAEDAIRFARQWGTTAEKSKGRCSIIIGAGVNHWYHNNLIYRACITALMITGCIGKNGGGWNHYVGQEKLVPVASWAPIAFGQDWSVPPRLQNAPSFHYMHSSQWRYDRPFQEVCPVTDREHPMARGHTADRQAMAVRSGWLPCFPQFNKPNHEVLADARADGAQTVEQIASHLAQQLKQRDLRFSMEDPDNPESWPRVWYIWRGNALQASAKGHEYYLKHYLGTKNAVGATQDAEGTVEDVIWRDAAAEGKLDLVVDLNFRMDTSALYSDVVLPTASWYEKDDLNTTDLHTFIHPLQAAVTPCWESKSDWQIFRELAWHTQQLAIRSMPEPIEDIVLTPLQHDTPAEVAQRKVQDWAKGECEPVPGKTMANVAIVEREYTTIYNRYVSLGPKFRAGLGHHGIRIAVDDLYDAYAATRPTETWDGSVYPSLREDRWVCDAILHFAPESNGELAWRAFQSESEKTGRDHSHLAADTREVRYTFEDIIRQPRRVLTSPFWTGITKGGQTYTGFAQNVQELIPWRTLTGRQHLYLDHEVYRAFGEHMPTFKPRPDRDSLGDLDSTPIDHRSIVLNYITPHGKWHIHSTYGDTLRMETLSRGIEPFWMNDRDAGLLGIRDNDWVEIFNDHGVVVSRACVSARIPRGMCFIYHATERTIGTPKTMIRSTDGKPRRAGAHNSLTRARLKPIFMIGGYAQFTYSFNYWGPPGINRDTYVVVRKTERTPQW